MPTTEGLKREIAELYDGVAASYDRSGPGFHAHFGRRLVELSRVSEGGAVLDVATGRGAVLFAAAEKVGAGGRVTGIDISENMVGMSAREIARRGMRNVTVRRMDAEQLDFPDATFDHVLCASALFYFPNIERLLAEFYRVLKPGGRFAGLLWGEYDARWYWLADLLISAFPPGFTFPSHWPQSWGSTLPPEKLEATLDQAGFADVHTLTDSVEFEYADAEEWWSVMMSSASRFAWDAMTPEVRDSCKGQAFAKLGELKRAGGIHHLLTTLVTLADKPAVRA